jgi:hypothetical protein
VKLTRRSFDLAGLEVPALDFTGAADGPLLTVPADGLPMFITSSPAVAADGLLMGLGIR